jgi:hypothetical protein
MGVEKWYKPNAIGDIQGFRPHPKLKIIEATPIATAKGDILDNNSTNHQ